jgi:hypothetical protein
MDEKESLQTFNVKCIDYRNEINDSTVQVWYKTIENPEVYDIVYDKLYKFSGNFRIYCLEYRDTKGNVFQNESDRLSNAFYGLCKKLEKHKIKLLIKGCNIDYYMIPRLQYSIKAIKLILGKRTDKNDTLIMIFDLEEDLSKIVTVDEQLQFYNKWLESIKGTPSRQPL